MLQSTTNSASAANILFDSWHLILGWLLFIAVIVLTRMAQRFKSARMPMFLLLAGITLLWIAGRYSTLSTLLPVGFFLFGIALAFFFAKILVFLVFDMLFDRRRGLKTPALMKAIVLFSIALVVLLIYNEFLPTAYRFDATSILASAAVVSVVLGFALQDTLGNLFSGLALHMESPLKVGQWVRIGDITGRVVEMDWRSVKLITLSGDYNIIPNSSSANSVVINYNDPPRPHRRELEIRAPWSASPDSVRGAILPILQQHPDIANHPAPTILIKEFREHWIEYEIRYWYSDFGLVETLDGEIRRQVWYHFRRNRIDSPTPLHDVTLTNADTSPDNAEQQLAELRRYLRSIAIFQPLSDDELERIVDGMHLALYAAGESIITQGDEGDSFFVIARGEAEVRVKDEEGNSSTVKLLRRGDYFGEMALLTGERRTATITAISESACYILSSEIFSEVMKANPDIAETLSDILSRRREELRESLDTLKESQSSTTAEHRSNLLSRIRSYFGI